MYLSQPKSNLIKFESSQTYINKQNILPSTQFTIYPPKMHRVSSTSSVLHLEQPTINTSLSKDFKSYRDFSKTKMDPFQSRNTNMSFNSTYDMGKFNNDFNTQRYSCNIDIDRNSDNVKSIGNVGNSIERKSVDAKLENKVKELEQRMKKNQESLKFYCQQIQHFKNQFSSSTSHLLDSINTNVLTVSTREPLKEFSSNTLSINSNNTNNSNKQNLSKNITTIDSVTNSPRESDLQKKLKQIDQVKKDVKKLMGREETMKGDMKLFQSSIKDILTGFREYLMQSVEGLSKMQEKNKKRIFDKVTEQMDKRFRDLVENQFQTLKKMIQKIQPSNMQTKCMFSITKSSQKFINDPILIKVKEQVYCMVKKVNKISPFESYQDMIKRNIYESMGRSSHSSTYPRMSDELQRSDTNYDKVTFEEAQVTYYIDDDGYLLDLSGYYLLKDNEKIRLNEVQIAKLKENNILKELYSIQ